MKKLLPIADIQKMIAEKLPPGMIVAEHTEREHRYRHVPSDTLVKSVTTKSGILESEHLKIWSASLAVEHIDRNWETVILPTTDRKKFFKSAVMVHRDVFEDAGSIGTEGHKTIERYLIEWMKTGIRPKDIRHFITEKDTRLHAIARSAEEFMKDFGAEPIVSEQFIFSLRYKFGGTMDSLFMLNKVLEKGQDLTSLFGEKGCPHDSWWQGKGNGKIQECIQCGQLIEKIFTLVDWKTSNDIDKPEYAMQVSAYWKGLIEMTGLKPEEILIVRLDKEKLKYEVRRLVNRTKAFQAFVNLGKVYDWLNDGEQKLVNYNAKELISINDIIFKTV